MKYQAALGFLSASALSLINGAAGQGAVLNDAAVVDFVRTLFDGRVGGNAVQPTRDLDGVDVPVLGLRNTIFLEGIFRDGFVNRALGVEDGEIVGLFPAAAAASLQTAIQDVNFGSAAVVQSLNEAIADDFAQVIDEDDIDAFLEQQDEDIRLYSAILVNNIGIPHGPGMFCVDDLQCKGNREERHGSVAKRDCNGLELDDGVNPSCDAFVAFFTLQWLFGWIIATYVLILMWMLYWAYPVVKRRFSRKAREADAKKNAKPEYSEQEQLIINTLAAQCASSENMLFQATDMLKQAKNMKNILSVEARRENRLMLLTVEYFQAMSAIMVSLTHQYLDNKTWSPGEKFNDADPAVRALQLEVLNYVRDRLQLAFQAEALTDKSLLRIAEAYAILKRISDSIVLVGFSADKEVDEGLGNLHTPIVDITENAVYLSGIFKAARGGLESELEGGEVCIPIKNADTRNLKEVGALYYLSDSARDAKNFDPQLGSVTGSQGKALTYALTNAGMQGETLQYFVRTFWGPEISQIQQEASTWLKSDTSMESWIESERASREAKAAPVVKRGAKKKRKKDKKKKKHKNQTYEEDASETATEYTEASGWSVEGNNTFVFNVDSVVNQGLGIAGKAGMPFLALGDNRTESGRFTKFTEAYFPNVVEWPKFYFIVFVLIPIIIAIPMLVKIGQGARAVDIDGNVVFKARAAGFGISFLGVPGYYFLDGNVPDLDDLEVGDGNADADAVIALLENVDPFDNGGAIFLNNAFVQDQFLEFDGTGNSLPDGGVAEIQAGVLVQANADELQLIQNQQKAQETGTMMLYALMHISAYFFGIIPLSLVRESLEIIARRFPLLRDIYPMSQWRELHMNMGLAAIFYVVFGATVFLVMLLISMGRGTPFSGLAGDPNIPNFFDMNDNVLYIRQLLLPAVPLLLLMKYASRGPPVAMRKYAPTFITKNYWEICYGLHYIVAFTAIIMLVLYRPQVFYWMGATWGFVWGGNKIVRILRTRKTTIKNTNLISYAVEDKRNNAKKRSDVLRITLNVPRSFPASSRGQACWLTVPDIDYVAHPFTLAKVPTPGDMSVTFHMAIKYLAGDDIISYARPEATSMKKQEMAAPPADPNALPPGWKSAVDPESNQTYYYNSAERRTTWNQPKSTLGGNLIEGARFLTSRFSTNLIRGNMSTRLGEAKLNGATTGEGTIRVLGEQKRATWTQKLAKLSEKLSGMDEDLRRNAIKDFPVYVSAPLGTSMDDCLVPSLPGSIIITTQNGLPAAESSVRWLLSQPKSHRPKFHFFVSVSREVNDALSVVETLRDSICDSVVAGHLNIDGLNTRHAHMADWLGVQIHLTRRKPSQIEGDRDMLMKSLSPPAAPVSPQQQEVIESWVKNRVSPGRLAFDRFLQRSSQMVMKRAGSDRIAVGYCGSAKIAYSIRAAARRIPNMTFDGEYI